MDIRVLEAEDADMYRLFEICSLAFEKRSPLFNATWPEHWTEHGRRTCAERFKNIKHTDADTTFLKAVDSSSNKILGMAKWNIYDNCIPEVSKTEGWEVSISDPDELAYVGALFEDYLTQRLAALARARGTLVSLDTLAVDPAYHRMGIGGALVKWGTKQADEIGSETVVEANEFGKGLYEKEGFEFIKNVEIHVHPRWKDRPKQVYAWLVRPKKELRQDEN